MEKRDFIMDNIKKIEFILYMLFKKVNKKEEDGCVFKFFSEILNINILDVNDEEFYNKIENSKAMSTENIIALINILKKAGESDLELKNNLCKKISILNRVCLISITY